MSFRLVFLGTPDFAVASLARIIEDGHDVAAVYSQPPRRAGRGMGLRASAVARFAETHGLPVRTPASLKTPDEQDAFASLEPDAAVVVAYGLLLPAAILEAPRLGCYNVHASLLPRWRGAAPTQRAIMAGDAVTGISIMRMTQGLDEGPVCLAEAIPIVPGTTAGALHDDLAALGANLMSRALAGLAAGALDCTVQPAEGVTYARKIDKSETRIDFAQSAAAVLNHIHGLSPHPGAWFTLPSGPRVKVLKAEIADGSGPPGTVLDDALSVACGEGAVRLLVLQREGKSPASVPDFLRGLAVPPGTRLGPGLE
ncbi:MAG TPA: methionyl-tRNA formyltransferase [Aestuariivirgaceae bacterium]|nr:methionyl-tRNA formyltransferase [Aestuariivirgaceae bacterium]